jgi:hypothetical protein
MTERVILMSSGQHFLHGRNVSLAAVSESGDVACASIAIGWPEHRAHNVVKTNEPWTLEEWGTISLIEVQRIDARRGFATIDFEPTNSGGPQ